MTCFSIFFLTIKVQNVQIKNFFEKKNFFGFFPCLIFSEMKIFLWQSKSFYGSFVVKFSTKKKMNKSQKKKDFFFQILVIWTTFITIFFCKIICLFYAKKKSLRSKKKNVFAKCTQNYAKSNCLKKSAKVEF